MPTNTTNLSLKKPIVGADEDLWGGYINDNLDDLDAYLSGTTAIPALTVGGVVEVDTARPQIFLHENDRTGNNTRLENSFDNFNIAQVDDTNSSPVNRLSVEMDTGDISFYEDTGTTAKFVWDASAESLGIGTSSPDSLTHLSRDDITAYNGSATDGQLSAGTTLLLEQTGGSNNAISQIAFQPRSGYGYNRIVSSGGSAPYMTFAINNTERMRLNSDGTVGIGSLAANDRRLEVTYAPANGTATTPSAGIYTRSSTSSTQSYRSAQFVYTHGYYSHNFGHHGIVVRNYDGNTSRVAKAMQFLGSGGGQIGYIGIKDTGTQYITSSDYRLKEDVQPMTGASDRVMALNPVNFAWKSTGDRVDGFLAHEAQEVVPEAVSGEKDAVMTEEYEVTPAVYDEDGNVVAEAVMGTREVPNYQGIDQSKLVPLLTAALQEALQKIDALETRVAALEA